MVAQTEHATGRVVSEQYLAGAAETQQLGPIRARMSGPGGYYNLGNALGLVSGITVHISLTRGSAHSEGAALAIVDFLAGSPAALALSLAMIIFFAGGELYHRAWTNGFPPNAALNRSGDALSGIGALVLGIGLLILGHPILALTSGLLHALGKFGSAWTNAPDTSSVWPEQFPDPWRTLVLASRVPAIIAVFLELQALPHIGDSGTMIAALVTQVSLLICYLLWAKADLLLFRSKD